MPGGMCSHDFIGTEIDLVLDDCKNAVWPILEAHRTRVFAARQARKRARREQSRINRENKEMIKLFALVFEQYLLRGEARVRVWRYLEERFLLDCQKMGFSVEVERATSWWAYETTFVLHRDKDHDHQL